MTEPIAYSKSLVNSLEKSLRSAFNPDLSLTRKPNNSGARFMISLREGDRTSADAAYWLKNIVVADERTTFYVGFAVSFEVETEAYVLDHSSLAVFHDILELTPLFRAEFHPKNAADEASDHAQPHWHFTQKPEDIEYVVRTMINEPVEFGQKSEFFGEFPDCSKFHFAMSPLWEKGKTLSYKQVFETADFPQWFDNLTKYIARQIAYVVKKAPTPVKTFAP